MDTWYNKYAVIVGGALVGFFAYDLIAWKKLDAAAWATWVGSLGTVGTLVGTIYLATSQARELNREKLTVARLLASNMYLRLVHAESLINGLNDIVDKCEKRGEETPRDLEFALELVDKVEIWKTDELIPLAVLPNNLAAKLVTVAAQLNVVRKILVMATDPELPREAKRPPQTLDKQLSGHLKTDTLVLLKEAKKQCWRASQDLEAKSH